jgi:transaldolase
VHSVVLFSLSQVDAEMRRQIFAPAAPGLPRLVGKAAVAQAKIAYWAFCDLFSGPRWEAQAVRGANPQRLAWASTSSLDRARPDTFYIHHLIGPDTITLMDTATVAAFEDRGTVARSVDQGLEESAEILARLQEAGIDLNSVGRKLENEHLSASTRAYEAAVAAVGARAAQLSS